jgi:hypothetical protein
MRKSLLWTGVLLCAVASTPSPALAQTIQSLEKSEKVTRAQLPRLQADMSKLGPIRSITFKQVAPDGLDVYEVTMANGAIESGIFVSANGRIETAWIHPADPAARPAASH